MLKLLSLIAIVLIVLFVVACGSSSTPPPPTPDVNATTTQIAASIFATQTASVPTVTQTPTNTATPLPTNTSTLTLTPLPTWTPTATNTPRPVPTALPPDEFIFNWKGQHYECDKKEIYRGGFVFNGARWFQVVIDVKNVSADKTLQAPWQPSRWIITNGKNSHVDTKMWQYSGVGSTATNPQFFQQPILSPGISSEWTFGAYPIQADEWVDHLEWDLFGRTYKSPSFSPGEFGNSFNYTACP